MTKQWFFTFYNQWEGIFSPHTVNWVDFTFFDLSIEWDKYFGQVNWSFAILGFSFTGGYTYDPDNENLKSLKDQMEKLYKDLE